MILNKISFFVFCFITTLFFSGCAGTYVPPEVLQWDQETLKVRNLQTRKFDTLDEKKMLSACASLLQDLGFTLEESETELGMMLGTKDRSAEDGGQIAAAVLFAVAFGVALPTDDHQKFRASVITKPSLETNDMVVRVTFQRVVWNTNGQVSTAEALTDPKMYTEFFEKLSKAVFLEAHEI